MSSPSNVRHGLHHRVSVAAAAGDEFNAKLDALKRLLHCEAIGGGSFAVRDARSQKVVDDLRSVLDRAKTVEEARSVLQSTKRRGKERRQQRTGGGAEDDDLDHASADTTSDSDDGSDEDIPDDGLARNEEWSGGLIFELIRGKAPEGVEVDEERRLSLLKLILTAGTNPDLSDRQGRCMRPLHACARDARLEEAKLLFLCRPQLDSRNADDDTPLAAAQRDNYKGEEDTPELRLLRPRVAEEMTKFYQEGFPRLSRLACQRDWFAVKNLVRRQAVAESELKGTFGGKTAREWALHYGLSSVAEELEYYEGLLFCKVVELFNQVSAMQRVFAQHDEQITMLKERIRALESSSAAALSSSQVEPATAESISGKIPHRLRPYHHAVGRDFQHDIISDVTGVSGSIGEASGRFDQQNQERAMQEKGDRSGMESLDANRSYPIKEEELFPSGATIAVVGPGAGAKVLALADAMREEHHKNKDHERQRGGPATDDRGPSMVDEVGSTTCSEDRSGSVELLIDDGVNVLEF